MTYELKELKRQLDNTNKALDDVKRTLIKHIDIVGIEYINLYDYINKINTLKTRKNLILYKIALLDKQGLFSLFF